MSNVDGGGIRGYSSLLILQTLMHKVYEWERRIRADTPQAAFSDDDPLPDENDLLPCHYFDYMYGTSTGGLIATMLGRLRMSIPQCLEVYREVGESLFGSKRSILPLTTKYDHKPLVHAVRDIVKAHCKQHTGDGECDGNDWYPWGMEIKDDNLDFPIDLDRHICQSICLTAVHNSSIDEAHLLRTYDHRYIDIPNWITPHNEGADKLHIWEVTRATSAAPFYFDTLEADLRGEKWSFKDGGIRENNPAGAAWSEFVSLYGEGRNPAVLLSLGTGRPDESQDGFATAWPGPFGKSPLTKKMAEKFAVLKNLLVKYTAGEEKHKTMINTARGEHTWYKRLNVSAGLEGLPLDSWKKGWWHDPATGIERHVSGGDTLSRMEDATAKYLGRDLDKRYDTYAPPRVMVEQAAEKLVRQRMARLAASKKSKPNKRRWDTYMGRYLTGDDMGTHDGPLAHPIKKTG